MRKANIGMVLALAVSFVLVLAVLPAAAKGKPGKPPPEPPTPNSVTCTWDESEGMLRWDDPGNPYLIDDRVEGFPGGFRFTLDAANSDACYDVITSEAGQWNITVTGSGVKWMLIVPRDAFSPGDSCGGVRRRGAAVYDPWVLPLPYPDDDRTWFPIVDGDNAIPDATVNACAGNDGNALAWDERLTADSWGEFSEWLDFNSDGIADDGEYVMEPDPDQVHPLAFLVFSQLFKDATVEVCVDLPPTGDFTDC